LPLKPSDTAIQPLILGDTAAALHAAKQLQARGVYVAPIRPPTVPRGTARLRISLTAAHTHDQVDRLLEALGRGQF
ncbi:MAG TPA: aminotransferase class I/II-fold pyridoxal phosphate-dependent enzyme, partial [Gammaproteobacteria bacterium]|nr:aminotransferase class I/II-fold pyridoxal phosphate-dependent enzyme [Gammaproteobacteria bacterium]